MPISIDRKVSVIPAVIAPVKTTSIQNCLLISDNNDIFSGEKYLEFTNSKDVSEKFGIDSKEAKFARVYFRGHETSTKIPEKLIIIENYSSRALPSSVTSTDFSLKDVSTIVDSLKKVGGNVAQPSIAVSKIIEYEYKDSIFESLKEIGEPPSKSYITSQKFSDEKKQSLLDNLKTIANGDFSIVFIKGEEEVPVTVTDVNLTTASDLNTVLDYIKSSINPKIRENEGLGDEYQIDISAIDGDDFYIKLNSQNAGAKYKINRVSSSTPENNNIASYLMLNDSSEPEKEYGKDQLTGNFSITFNVNGEQKKATVNGLNFHNFDSLENQLNYLTNEINGAISAAGGLGNDYKVTIEIETSGEPADSFSIVVKTNNTGLTYSIVDIPPEDPEKPEENIVANILRLSEEYDPTFYPGSDKEFGDFSIEFTVGDKKVIATADKLDFSDKNTLEIQLNYLSERLNDAIVNTEGLDMYYKVLIKENTSSEEQFNISINTNSTGSKYTIGSVFSKIPIEGDRVDTILKLGDGSNPPPIKIPGIDNITLSEMLNRFIEIRNDWWTIATVNEKTEKDRMEIATWVNEQNKGCRFVYICQDSSRIASTTTSNEDTFGFQANSKGMSGTTVIYGNETHAAFIASVAATLNFEIRNGVLTFSGRRQNGLEITANSDSEAKCLESNFYNYYGSYSNNEFKYRFLETGIVGGDHIWLNSLFKHIWLNHMIQMDLLNLLIDVNSIPFNSSGYTLIDNCCNSTINKAKNNGTIVAGVELSSLQKAILKEMVGKDISEELRFYGYYFYLKQSSSEERLERKYTGGILFYCDGGSIQSINLIINVLL